jgi:hypothetical protein
VLIFLITADFDGEDIDIGSAVNDDLALDESTGFKTKLKIKSQCQLYAIIHRDDMEFGRRLG